MIEGPLMMVIHGAGIAIVLYILMKYVFNFSHVKSLYRSVVFGLLISAYMIAFGHGLPTSLNRNL